MTNARDERGRFLTLPPGAAPPITSDNAHAMIAKRVEKYRRAANKRILEEARSVDPSVSIAADAFALAAAKQFNALLDTDKPAIDHLDRLRRIMTGAESERANVSVSPQLPAGVNMSVQSVLDLVDALAQHRQHLAEQARAVDAAVMRNENADEQDG